jgi:hypothetical protein
VLWPAASSQHYWLRPVAAGRDATFRSRHIQQSVGQWACYRGLVVAGVSINSFINDNDVRLMESSWTLFALASEHVLPSYSPLHHDSSLKLVQECSQINEQNWKHMHISVCCCMDSVQHNFVRFLKSRINWKHNEDFVSKASLSVAMAIFRKI